MKAKRNKITKAVNIHTGKALSLGAVFKGVGAAFDVPMREARTTTFAKTPCTGKRIK